MTQNPDSDGRIADTGEVTNGFMARLMDLFNITVKYEDGRNADGTDGVSEMAGHLIGLLELILLDRCAHGDGNEAFNLAATGYRRAAMTYADRVIPANMLGAHDDRVMALTTTLFVNRVGFTGNMVQNTYSGDAFAFVALADVLSGATSYTLRLLAGETDPSAWRECQRALNTYIEAVGPLYGILRGVLALDGGERDFKMTSREESPSDTPNTEVPHARVAGGTPFHANRFPGPGSAAPGAGPS